MNRNEITTIGKGEWRGSFTTRRNVSATKKYHHCNVCERLIQIGSPAIRFSGVFEYQFYSVYIHPECKIMDNSNEV